MASRRLIVSLRGFLAARPVLQRGYVWLYRRLCPARYEEFRTKARNVTFLLPWRQPDGSLEAAKVDWDYEDMVRETILFGTYMEEYVRFRFDRLNGAERREYLTDEVRNAICRQVNHSDAQALLADKYRASVRYRDFYGRETLLLEGHNKATRDRFMHFVQRHGEVVVKPIDQCAGRGVRLLTRRSEAEWLRWFDEQAPSHPAAGGSLILEERIGQDARMAAWHPRSVNTIRANTIFRHGHFLLFSTFLRTGRGNSFMDNCGQGGLLAAVDAQSGRVVSDGCNDLGDRLTVHPDSGLTFRGAQIPEWEGLCQLVERLARFTPDLAFVAWDLALTPQGWVMVEGNKGQFMVQQMALQRGIRKDFERALSL